MFQTFNVLLLKYALEAVTCRKFCLKYQPYETQMLTQQKRQLNASPMQKPFRGFKHSHFYKTKNNLLSVCKPRDRIKGQF